MTATKAVPPLCRTRIDRKVLGSDKKSDKPTA